MTDVKRRNTWQQTAVREALEREHGFINAQALHLRMANAGSTVSVATVYRALSRMAEDGEADVHIDTDGQQLFRACGSEAHHHHLICRRCGATVEISAPPVERWAREVAAEHGYTDETHVIDVIGLCPKCTAARAAQLR
ncbi:Fur family transcriptional regulator [Pseudoclavibacter sp. 13-3]|uniref:Fur family transcriptional regulator n=1 Tax=Pseudoclavibacter sp. 13-3 TaxID=2901228 RepID=UPI001E3447C4|nr:transcriptional repressor [Pseudoclavibacter sp. 13-3]MCD7101366.1 transcriptional repressor [Pseudoclavibacter sp. 13-3]